MAGNSMPKQSLLRNNKDTIYPLPGVLRGSYIRKINSPKGRIIAWLEFEFTDFEVVYQHFRGCHRVVMVKAMDCGIVVTAFEFQSCYYVHFRTETLGKGIYSHIFPGLNSTTTVLLEG